MYVEQKLVSLEVGFASVSFRADDLQSGVEVKTCERTLEGKKAKRPTM